ncbi:hypothetical protein [Raoultella ornithinolytica]|uniref:hypothetical protein n=1 Tax=Raoultella ornithinolytica TaxID=54291 RepID=UPI001265D704|nr:hypothetical protein [Raoultella ornithinolytica]KAB8128513.1 hypothetical protein FNH10_26220 [Raoultella ornithinolytica]
MKIFFSGSSAQLCIEAETEADKAMLIIWHQLNISDQTMYCDMVEPGCLAGLRLCGITDHEKE